MTATLELLARPTAPLSTDRLADLVRDVASLQQMWSPLVRYREPRWWTCLRHTDEVDVWLLTWLPDHATDLHDHGPSAGAFTVVAGTLLEVTADRHSGRQSSRTLRPGRCRTVERQIVHDVRNPGSQPAISIHAYSPPLTEMTFYRKDNNGLSAITSVATHGEPEVLTG